MAKYMRGGKEISKEEFFKSMPWLATQKPEGTPVKPKVSPKSVAKTTESDVTAPIKATGKAKPTSFEKVTGIKKPAQKSDIGVAPAPRTDTSDRAQ